MDWAGRCVSLFTVIQQAISELSLREKHSIQSNLKVRRLDVATYMILQVVCTHSEYFQLGALLGSRVSVTWCVEPRVTCQQPRVAGGGRAVCWHASSGTPVAVLRHRHGAWGELAVH